MNINNSQLKKEAVKQGLIKGMWQGSSAATLARIGHLVATGDTDYLPARVAYPVAMMGGAAYHGAKNYMLVKKFLDRQKKLKNNYKGEITLESLINNYDAEWLIANSPFMKT